MRTTPKILIANRGEIAVRIIRSCRDLGLRTVAVHSEVDADALHVRLADESVLIGPAEASASYLNIPAVVQAARKTGARFVHPGYGFLSENEDFVTALNEQGIRFIGPEAATIALTGDKLAARKAAREAGLPVLGGSEDPIPVDMPLNLFADVRFPVLVKAVSGGGGKGIRLATTPSELMEMVAAARKEAMASFGDDTVYLEQLVQSARHIEVQIIGDGKGKVVCLGERECSIQRRRQKLIEEAPAPNLPPSMRQKLYDDALRLGKSLNYRSLGTVEFLMDQDGNCFFIEVNPRIQVEHPVTEAVTHIDLVTAQIQLALTGEVPYVQDDINMRGSAIEARVLAEDAENGFLPASGTVDYLKEPGGPGIRLDSALYPGMQVSPFYDSLLSKVIAWGEDRRQAVNRIVRALGEYRIGGIPTDLEFLLQVIDSDGFRGGRADTTFLDHFQMVEVKAGTAPEEELAIAAAWMSFVADERKSADPVSKPDGWRFNGWIDQMTGLR